MTNRIKAILTVLLILSAMAGTAADLNIDGTVNYRDLGILGAHYGNTC